MTAGWFANGNGLRSETASNTRLAAASAHNRRARVGRRLWPGGDMDIRLRTAIAPRAYPFWFAWRLCVDTVGAGCTGVGVNKLGPPGLMLFSVEDTGGVVVVVVVAVVIVVVVEGFSSPLPPHAAVSPPIAIRALVPATAARQRTLRDLMMFPIYARPAVLRRARTLVQHRNPQINAVAYICPLQENRNFPSRLGQLGRAM